MYEKEREFLVRWAYRAVWIAFLYLLVRYVAVWLLPFLLALGLSALLWPAVEALRRSLQLKVGFSATVLSALVLLLLAGGLWYLAARLVEQASGLLGSLPQQLGRLPGVLEEVQARFDSFCAACPEEVRRGLEEAVGQLAVQLPELLAPLSAWCVEQLGALVSALPQVGLFLFTTALALFFTAPAYGQIRAFGAEVLPEPWRETARAVKGHFLATLGKWLRAEAILIVLTFVELWLGLNLLGQPYALLLSVLIALIDALPVLGTGSVLIPWGLVLLLLGRRPRGIAILLLYGVITVVRNILEPKLMASSVGLPPLPALVAMYVGWCTLGVGGMLLFPLVLLFAKQLYDGGLLRFGK